MAQEKSLRPPERSANDIARELRAQFTRSLFDVTGAEAPPDPILAALFESLAMQVDRVYQEADQVFFAAALDDLIRGLGMPARLARPAQAVVQWSQIQARETVASDVELLGYRASGEQIVFAPDAAVEIAPTELAFAGLIEGGRLTTIAGARLPGANAPVLPGSSTPAPAGAAPLILLAFDCDPGHLSRLGIFFDTPGATGPILSIIARSPWQLLDANGTATERGVLRSTPGRGGVRNLAFFREPTPGAEPAPSARAVPLAGGVYGSSLWVMPEISPDRRWKGMIPPAFKELVPRVLPAGHERALDRQLAWIQIPLPAGTRAVANQLNRVAVNCVTASNIEIWNEQIDFDRMGSVVSHRPMGDASRHVMGVLAVTGESGTTYLDASDLEAPAGTGRYRYRGNARFEFSPAKQASGRFDSYAMLRLLYCDGDEGNAIAPGEIKQLRTDLPRNPIARVASLTPSKGGAAPPKYEDARDRFAELLRTRERIVTAADIEIAARAFEPLLRRVEVDAASEITDAGLGLVTRVTAFAAREDFAAPEAELERLTTELERYLQDRCMIGQRIQVTIRIVGGAR